MPQTNESTLKSAALQDVPLSMVTEQFRDVLARSSKLCDAEWGTRDDDDALVFHFFPPGYAADRALDWPNWTAFRDALEGALLLNFDLATLEAGYVDELKSFFAILSPRPQVPDLTSLIEKFFSDLES